MNTPTWTVKEAAQAALGLRGECNLSGVLLVAYRIACAAAAAGWMAADFPATRLAVHQAAFLATGRELLDSTEWARCHDECVRQAAAEAAPPDA